MAERKFRIRYADVAATLALVMASGGTAYAATALPKNSVGTPQIKAEAVTAAKVRPDAIASAKVRNRSITESDLAEGSVGATQLADGPISTVKIGAGQITEGHLAPDTVTGAKVTDHSLTLADLDASKTDVGVGGLPIAADQCAHLLIGVSGAAQPGDIALVGWVDEPPTTVAITAARVSGTSVHAHLCNLGNTDITIPPGLTVRVVTIG